jgi:hypothetical protein
MTTPVHGLGILSTASLTTPPSPPASKPKDEEKTEEKKDEQKDQDRIIVGIDFGYLRS